jgi:GNAT superfamily N-acetyltransferase
MDRGQWIDLNAQALVDWFRAVATASTSGRLIERDGVVAVVSPRIPARSVFNSVAYTDPGALTAARQEIAADYARDGCAWTVWVPAVDTGTAAMLAEAGHVLDAAPRAMGMELAGIEPPDLAGIDWTGDGDFEQMTLLNDRAYRYAEGTWLNGLGARPRGSFIYTARVDGEPAATVMTIDHPGGGAGPDCSIWCVATVEAARGRGLASALMKQGLWDARQRGCATTTLQATAQGRPVYERLGYQDVGAIQMWEFRPPELAGDAQPKPAA